MVITNPMELGRAVDEKNFMPDVKCLLNDNTIINLEMQVINKHNWSERSLSYLCRSFDNLNCGDDYLNVKTAIHISLLDFTLFPDIPEFYFTNMMINIRNHKIFSDRLRLSVLDLTQIKLATEEDKQYHIDYWASLFKATTWEEIKMLAQKDSFIEEASNTIFQLTEEEQIRQQCEAREDFLYWQRRKDNYINELEETNAKKDTLIAEKDAAIAKHLTTITKISTTIIEKESEIAEKEATIMEKEALIVELQARIKTLET